MWNSHCESEPMVSSWQMFFSRADFSLQLLGKLIINVTGSEQIFLWKIYKIILFYTVEIAKELLNKTASFELCALFKIWQWNWGVRSLKFNWSNYSQIQDSNWKKVKFQSHETCTQKFWVDFIRNIRFSSSLTNGSNKLVFVPGKPFHCS